MQAYQSLCPACHLSLPAEADRCPQCGCAVVLDPEEHPVLTDEQRETIRGAARRIRQSLLEHPEDGEARYGLALCYYSLGLLEESVEQFKAATQAMPERVDVRHAEAVALIQVGSLAGAAQTLNRAVSQDPTCSAALVLRGLVREHQGRVEEAVSDWQRAFAQGDATACRFLERFVRKCKPLIAAHVDEASIDGKMAHYLRVLTTSPPAEPRPLGATTMRVLHAVWPQKAEVMEAMYGDRVDAYRKLVDELARQRGAMNNDLIGLSELCLTAYRRSAQDLPGQLQREAYARPVLSLESRRAALDQELGEWSRRGYRVVSRTDTTAQLVKPKRFSCLWATLWFLVFGVGFLIYLFYYASKKDSVIYLEVDPLGRVLAR